MENEGAFGFRGEGFVQVPNQSVEARLRGQVHADLKQNHGFSLQAGNKWGVSVELIQTGGSKGKLCLDKKDVTWPSDP